jgi:hypothetical protein
VATAREKGNALLKKLAALERKIPTATTQPPAGQTKYKNKRVLWQDQNGDPHWYDSKAECNYAKRLALEKRAGLIQDWRPHPRLKIVVEGFAGRVTNVTYVPDFYVLNLDATFHYVDVKGYVDPRAPYWLLYSLKRSLAETKLGITVLEVRAA